MDIDYTSENGRVSRTAAFDVKSLVTVQVGEEGEKFPVHAALLRQTSGFLNAALKEEWDASRKEERTMDLSDEKPGIFAIYLHWIYTKELPTIPTEKPYPNKKKHNSPNELKALAHCYVLGERLIDTTFKNAVMRAFCEVIDRRSKYEKCPDSQVFSIIYEGMPSGSVARSLLLDTWLDEAVESWESLIELMPMEFVFDLAKRQHRMICSDWVNGTEPWKHVEG